MSDLNFDLPRALNLAAPNAKFFLVGNSLDGLEWRDERPLPTEAQLRAAIEEEDARIAARKVWADKAAFWAEFTQAEQLQIMNWTTNGVRLLYGELLVWPGEVWSDDPKVQAGLTGLVQAGILTSERKQAILAI